MTRSVSDKSPMILRIGTGRLRTRVGIARIWWSLANAGFLTRSITSIRYPISKCSAQILFRFEIAASDFGVCPAT